MKFRVIDEDKVIAEQVVFKPSQFKNMFKDLCLKYEGKKTRGKKE
jgi:hypothetical protein